VATDLGAGITEEAAALARSAAYRLASQLLAYPTPDGVRRLREEDLPFAIDTAELLPEEVHRTVSDVAAAFGGPSPEELEGAYQGVFSHVHSADCPMFETDHTAKDVWRQSAELADLAGFYRAFGVEQHLERPDHVSTELEFLHLVSYKIAWALVAGDEEHAETCRLAEAGFLRDHVLRWLPGLVARVAVLGADGPYRVAAAFVAELLRAEASRLDLEAPEAAPSPVAPDVVGEIALCEEEA
jgi:nitrate reductase assembly molybdenum cofactor insertion protein NarJ